MSDARNYTKKDMDPKLHYLCSSSRLSKTLKMPKSSIKSVDRLELGVGGFRSRNLTSDPEILKIALHCDIDFKSEVPLQRNVQFQKFNQQELVAYY